MTARSRPTPRHPARPRSARFHFARLQFAPARRGALLPAALLLLTACQPPAPAQSEEDVAGEASVRQVINSNLPERPYSDGVQAGKTYYFSGRIGVTDETLAMDEGRVEAETRAVLESFRPLLEGAGLDFRDVVQATVFLTDMADYEGMNGVYAEYFPEDPPARETVAVLEIPGGAAVEISFVAVAR